MYGVNAAADGTDLLMRFGTGGTPTYASSNYGSTEPRSTLNSGSGAFDHSNGNYATSEFAIMFSYGDESDEQTVGRLDFYNLGSSTFFKGYHSRTVTFNGSDSSRTQSLMSAGVYHGSAAAVTGIKIYPASGTISAGTFNLFGVKNS